MHRARSAFAAPAGSRDGGVAALDRRQRSAQRVLADPGRGVAAASCVVVWSGAIEPASVCLPAAGALVGTGSGSEVDVLGPWRSKSMANPLYVERRYNASLVFRGTGGVSAVEMGGRRLGRCGL
jgi:hypothetical protein